MYASGAETLWLNELDAGDCDSSIAYADVDPRPGRELVMTTTSGAVAVWDTDGKQVYVVQLGGVFSMSPTVADVFPGPPLEVLAVNQAGRLTCLSGRKILWQYSLPGQMDWNCTTIVAEDLDGDRGMDILVGNHAGHLVCLSPEGVERWTYKVAGGFHCPPGVADLNPEPGLETVISTCGGSLICLSAAGKPVWEGKLGCDNISGPVIADLDGDGTLEIVIGGRDDRLHCFTADGKPLWTFPATAEIDSAISCGDLDGDGKREIVFVDLRGKCYCLSADGKQRWRYDVRNRCRRSPSLADFDGDGEMEILIAGYDDRMYLLSRDGQEEDFVKMPGTTNGGATLIQSSGRLAAVVPFEASKVGCYTWLGKGAPRRPAVLWDMYRVTPGQRGSLPAAGGKTDRPSPRRVSYGGLLVGRNLFEVQVQNPRREKLVVELRVKKPLSDDVSSKTVEAADELVSASLPYLVRGDGPETFVFYYAVSYPRATRPILAGRKSFFVEPFVRDLDAARRLIEDVERIEATLRDKHARRLRSLTGQRLWLEHRLAEIADRVAHPSRLSGADRVGFANELHSLAGQVVEPLGLARITLDRCEAGKQTVFAAWPANPWSPPRSPADRGGQAGAQGPLKDMSIDLYKNERGSLAIDVLNLLDTPLDLRVRYPKRLKGEGETCPELWVGQVIAVPTESENLSHDAIPELNRARVLHLAPGETRQIWLRINAGNSKAGTFTATVNLSSLSSRTVAENIAITAKVLDLDITGAPAPKFCNWAYVYSSCLKEYPAEARRDLVSHGTNVFVVTGKHMPRVKYDQAGKLIGGADLTAHDEFIRNHGTEAMFLFCGGPQGTLAGPKGHGFGSEAYRKAFKVWIPQWVAHLKKLGVGYDRFAFYPVDEPGLNPGLVERYIEVAKLTRETDPKILMYTDPVDRATIEEIRRMAPYVDIWCPNRNGFLIKPNDPRLPIMHKSGKQVWTYECFHGAKNQSPLGYYRGLAWLAELCDLTGIGFWSYCTSKHDPWYFPRGGHDYLLIYPGDGVVTSKRWEACLDGLEDLRAVWQLEALANAARRTDPKDKRVKRADRILAEAVAELAAFCREKTRFVPDASGIDSLARDQSVLDLFDKQHRAYKRHRDRIAQATLALRN